jgi:CHAD domain-containing protein
VAKARSIHGLSEDDPYAAVAAQVVAVRAAELAENAAGVLDTSEIERVHDMRVASRRLRAALEVFEPCFPRKRFKPALREVKELADALGERRDRDVTIAALTEFTAGIGAADRPGVQSLIAQLRDEQAEANLALAPHVSEERLAALGERLNELVREASELVAEPAPEPEPPERAPASEPERAPASEPEPEPASEPEPEPAQESEAEPQPTMSELAETSVGNGAGVGTSPSGGTAE